MTKEFLRRHSVVFNERYIAEHPAAVETLRDLGTMTTPVTVIGVETVIGFEEARLRQLLNLGNA
ncbi:MAG: glutaredoxin family protein [Armatimonadota bacterium]